MDSRASTNLLSTSAPHFHSLAFVPKTYSLWLLGSSFSPISNKGYFIYLPRPILNTIVSDYLIESNIFHYDIAFFVMQCGYLSIYMPPSMDHKLFGSRICIVHQSLCWLTFQPNTPPGSIHVCSIYINWLEVWRDIESHNQGKLQRKKLPFVASLGRTIE